MDQTFNTIIKSNKYTETCDACDMGIKWFPYERNHIFCHLQIIDISFSLCCILLCFRTMVAGSYQEICLRFELILLELLAQCLADQPVNHEVRISADRRSEMGIALACDTEMAGIFRLVACLRQ